MLFHNYFSRMPFINNSCNEFGVHWIAIFSFALFSWLFCEMLIKNRSGRISLFLCGTEEYKDNKICQYFGSHWWAYFRNLMTGTVKPVLLINSLAKFDGTIVSIVRYISQMWNIIWKKVSILFFLIRNYCKPLRVFHTSWKLEVTLQKLFPYLG